MTVFELTSLVPAVRYKHGVNGSEVQQLVTSLHHRVSSTNGQGDYAYHFYIGGRN